MLTQEELLRLTTMIFDGRMRSDPAVLSAADQMMDAMMQQASMVASVHEAADRDRAFQEGMDRAMQDARGQGAQEAAARDAAARDAAARDAAARDAAARDAAARDAAARDAAARDAAARDAAARDAAERAAARDHSHEAAMERQVAEHHECHIAAADRIHEARAMGGRRMDDDVLPENWKISELRTMSFPALIAAREEALGIKGRN